VYDEETLVVEASGVALLVLTVYAIDVFKRKTLMGQVRPCWGSEGGRGTGGTAGETEREAGRERKRERDRGSEEA
jgi:hypothetical protein